MRFSLAKSKGQALTEYGLIMGLIVIVVVALLIGFRNDIKRMFETVGTEVDTAADSVSGAD